MTNQSNVVLKLGGALLTDKSQPYTLRKEILEKVAEEIKLCINENLIENLVLVHGVGSYGHPPVLKHNLHKGFQNSEQLFPLSKTQKSVDKLKLKIINALHEYNLPIIRMYASSMVIGSKMKIVEHFLEGLKGYLSLGMIPLIGGDMIHDREMGFSVCSGDQLAVLLAREIQANYLLFATDVDGVYNKNPKIHEDASLISEINLNEFDALTNQIIVSNEGDASRQMLGKLQSINTIKDLVKNELKVAIFSMQNRYNLKRYLSGERILATIFSNE